MSAKDPKWDADEPPKPRTNANVEIPKSEDKFDKVDKLSIEEVLNMELFYNQQITNLNMSWLLHHEKSNLSIVGITQEHTYGFSVNNQYNSGTGGAAGQAFSAAVNAIHGRAHNMAPVFQQATMNDGWLDQGANLLSNIGSNLKIKPANPNNSTLGETLQNGVSDLATLASDGVSTVKDWFEGRKKKDSLANRIFSVFFKDEGGPTIDDFAHGKMITSVDKVMTYGGSDLSVTLPVLKTYIFHNPITDAHNVLDLTAALADVIAPQTAKSSIDGLYALQKAPGGFRADLNAFDSQTKPMEGTWTLVWNGYTIRNLLVSNLTVNYSKYNAMNNKGLDSGDPLYAEVDITLALASMLTSEDVMNMMTVTRNRFKTSGWRDTYDDGQTRGVTSKAYDIAGIGTNRKTDPNKVNSTSY